MEEINANIEKIVKLYFEGNSVKEAIEKIRKQELKKRA
jgi:hypothetical protein